MSKRKLNSVCQRHKDTAIKNFSITVACLIPVIIGFVGLFTKVGKENQFITYGILVILMLPVIHFFVEGMKGLLAYITYTKYYSPYEDVQEITENE